MSHPITQAALQVDEILRRTLVLKRQRNGIGIFNLMKAMREAGDTTMLERLELMARFLAEEEPETVAVVRLACVDGVPCSATPFQT